ncbi:RagB/SusD family nutrient uptake outer membrane protein [Sphingobacterium bambusae]|uniref:RagB/SusD family nutrient uptake outer membrane protein n=1 Tax=Sphingobacterium bambusae TaxID=662858 RepID=A0ABW6BEC0_9SPHI|nr:RagB/SusD family nutrient uptake outer membrane protein [Sphingobacterium bambusae]WPL48660.1 RagB/SusD family nutrient uptake outer membrane protein [Sphingobacterium bambusae]
MKNISFLLFTLLILFLAGCSSFLEVEPQDSVSDKVTIVDENSAETAVRGIYSALRSNDYYGYSFQLLGFFSADNIVYRGSQTVHQTLTNHTVKSDLAVLATAWNQIYNTINRANHVIAKVPSLSLTTSFTEAYRNQLIGEAHFVRALAYFDLARTWGGVQLILEPTNSASTLADVKRSSLQETYDQVLQDLLKAEELLPETTNRIRATRATARALLARYYLYQKNWDEAAKYASYIISDQANYELVKPYRSFYANNASNTKESVFELFYDVNNPSGQAGQWLASVNGGTAWIRPSSAIYTLLTDPLIGGDRSVLVYQTSTATEPNVLIGNLYYRIDRTDPTFLIRTAELYLIRAEALAQRNNGNDLANALVDLNAVRSRSNVPLIVATPTQSELITAIEQENRVEFALENHRWYDLLRTQRAQAVLAINSTDRLLLPIPFSQLAIDPNLEQNPGLD